ncbi:hypothetical protein ACWD7C_11525 [Streptomyces sp. NPDC005134]|uniref:hypothetical protein n=1 Tax=unclassified Streptomyces TaxID=2593676 RepID=UPI0033BAE02B
MSRAQWCCPAAVLAVVPGLFCGAATASGGGASQEAGTVAAPAVAGRRVPGCGKGATRDGIEPGVPVRARVAHGRVPGPAGWALPAAAGQGSAEPPVRVGLRGPEPAGPTPVELSVLRV